MTDAFAMAATETRARQEARLDQVMCTLEGMASLLGQTPGDLAVVIHGDRDCLGVVVQGMDYPGTERFFGTKLDVTEAVAGLGGSRLTQCLTAVCEELRPEVVFLVGTCLSVLVGEDPEPIARTVSAKTGVTVIPLRGAGMGFVSQAEILDQHACLLLGAARATTRTDRAPAPMPRDMPPGEGAPRLPARTEGGLALLGFHPGLEVLSQLSELGVRVRALLAPGACLDEWRELPWAEAHVVLDPWTYPSLIAALQKEHGHKTLQAPFPLGYGSTLAFFETLAPWSGLASGVHRALGPPMEAAKEALAAVRPSLSGRRLGFNLGSKKNLEPRTLARAGLGDLPALEEMGFVPVLLVQGDDAPGRLEAVKQTLGRLGSSAPIRVFADTVLFGDLCRKEGCELVYASDHLREEVAGTGIGFLAQGLLEPGFGAVAANIQRVLTALEAAS